MGATAPGWGLGSVTPVTDRRTVALSTVHSQGVRRGQAPVARWLLLKGTAVKGTASTHTLGESFRVCGAGLGVALSLVGMSEHGWVLSSPLCRHAQSFKQEKAGRERPARGRNGPRAHSPTVTWTCCPQTLLPYFSDLNEWLKKPLVISTLSICKSVLQK